MKSKHTILTIVTAIVASVITALAIAPDSAQQVEAEETAYERVMRTGVLRCGYFSWKPYFFKDPNSGEFSGIFYDYTTALTSLLSLKVEWVSEMSFGTYIEDINRGKYDAECTGGWPNALRGKRAFYSQPVYYIPIVAFARASDERLHAGVKVEDLNRGEYTVAVIDGENAQALRKIHVPKTQEHALPQTATGTEMLMDVATGKADFTFTDVYSGMAYMDANPDQVKMLPQIKLQLVAQNFTLPMGDVKLQSMLNTATDELWLSGKIDQILNSYELYPESFVRKSKP